VSLRLANILGPHLAIGPVPSFYQRLKAGQKCFCTEAMRDFLDILDFLSLMDIVLQQGAPTGIFNVSSGIGHSIREVFAAVSAHLRADASAQVVPIGDDDIAAVVLDPDRTRASFAWEAKIGFSEMISRVLCWYDRHGVSATYSHLRPVSGQR
jgi:UDP-glucose 4-epimerase